MKNEPGADTPPSYRQGEQPLHEYLRHHAHERPDKPAFIWYGRGIGYGELDRASDAFASLLHSLGVVAGDRVALYMGNCPQYVIAHFGIQKIGAIVSPCGPLFKAHELRYQLGDLGARVIVAARHLAPIVEEVRADTAIEHVFVTGHADMLPADPSIAIPEELRIDREADAAPAPGTRDLLATLETFRGIAPPSYSPDLEEVALMTYTSGTTGMPKGAMLSLRNALFKTAVTADCNGVRDDDVLLGIAPLYHIAGMLLCLDVNVYTGATAVLMHRFDPLATLQAIDRHRVTWWYSIAPMNVAVMQHPEASRYDMSSLRMNPATSFGITLTEPLARQWAEFTGGCPTYEAAYGLSETHTCDTYMPVDAVRWGTQGRPMPGVEIRIIDPDTGLDRPQGELGEIIVRSPGSFKGYWNKPEATAKTLRDGWVHTGDMGRLDEAGYLSFVGRFKEMIKVSGYSVFPEEVETILIRHPAISQAAVLGIPDPARGEVVRAYVVKKPGAEASAEEIIAWARENMASYKAPREVRFRDSLPATGAGKVLRRLLRDEEG
ncbi:MAG: AMP-binding protein [Burkholderiaceae bacterium]|jgi:long-chain acyl-CoA synthetase|nr:AMP-binding protein [Burkholderiaceae bacterium]MEB2318003.1 AMP-binding protein [Pseudomonadota bacterium]